MKKDWWEKEWRMNDEWRIGLMKDEWRMNERWIKDEWRPSFILHSSFIHHSSFIYPSFLHSSFIHPSFIPHLSFINPSFIRYRFVHVSEKGKWNAKMKLQFKPLNCCKDGILILRRGNLAEHTWSQIIT